MRWDHGGPSCPVGSFGLETKRPRISGHVTPSNRLPVNLGPSALLDLGGLIQVVVVSIRKQCADPVFFEMFGLDIARARTVVVKSRGHFRAGFDEFFGPDQVIEVDAPGLTSPVLSRFDFKNLPRPVFPLDQDADWTGPPWK